MTRHQTAGSSLAGRKDAARARLERRDRAGLLAWAGRDRGPLRVLSTLLFDDDPLIRWRAIEAMGEVAGRLAGDDAGKAHRQVQRLFWLMNDESGGLCRVAPEAIAEILHNVPSLLPEFGPMLPTYFDEEPFERGSRWAVARLGRREPDLFRHGCDGLTASLDDPEPVLRAYSWLALLALGAGVPAEAEEQLRRDGAKVPLYDYASGDLTTVRVSDIPTTGRAVIEG
jgi:hypothetical protein